MYRALSLHSDHSSNSLISDSFVIVEAPPCILDFYGLTIEIFWLCLHTFQLIVFCEHIFDIRQPVACCVPCYRVAARREVYMLANLLAHPLFNHLHDAVVEVLIKHRLAYLILIIPSPFTIVKRIFRRRERRTVRQRDTATHAIDAEYPAPALVHHVTRKRGEGVAHRRTLRLRQAPCRRMEEVAESVHDLANPTDKPLSETLVALAEVLHERHAPLHVGQCVSQHLLDHIRIRKLWCADLLAVAVELRLRERARLLHVLDDFPEQLLIVRLHPVQRLVPERPRKRSLALRVEERHAVRRMETVKICHAFEEHDRHPHRLAEVRNALLSPRQLLGRDKLDFLENLGESLLTSF